LGPVDREGDPFDVVKLHFQVEIEFLQTAEWKRLAPEQERRCAGSPLIRRRRIARRL
jgi:hypothetical protein